MDEYLLDGTQRSDVTTLLDFMNNMKSTFSSQFFKGTGVDSHVSEIAEHLIEKMNDIQDICVAALEATKSDFE